MQKPFYVKILLFATLLLGINAFAQEKDQASGDEQESLKSEIKEFIGHHLLDSHDFTLFTIDEENNEHVSFPLPVILWDNGVKVFMSSKFDHGQSVAEVDGEYYALYHGKIVKTDAEGTINYDNEEHATNVKPLDFSITKNVVFIILVSLIMIFMFGRMAKSYKGTMMPKGMGRFLEPIILYIRDDIAIPNIGQKHYRRYMGYLLTVFFFIWIINLLGLSPLGVNVTNNIAVTLCLAFVTFLITTFTANKNYWKHIFWMPDVPVFMKVVLAPIELLGTFIKPFSLMIRLYANITAGHLILMSILGMMFIFKNWMGSSLSFALASALSFLELLVAALQAYIFTMLSALYFGSAVEEHDDH
ncbi:ATP synthase subunit a [Arenibacter antarcticus]|uniref:ATP synthase subunit a n=1 Tax=Arenibacter antarcticus TaxID=2040469 RepID=A0ABW5V9D0_9FLAO|nr:F0F1 ATP synthase subunit A [Arenibacter sp. H213]MCM4167944.1 ATP synthase F0 subunit A [Arenibacter sp. H213]